MNILYDVLCSGYMSPEYAMNGIFSEKSDVYSFGVLLLEIVSGQKNTMFASSTALSLIEQVSSKDASKLAFNLNYRAERLFTYYINF